MKIKLLLFYLFFVSTALCTAFKKIMETDQIGASSDYVEVVVGGKKKDEWILDLSKVKLIKSESFHAPFFYGIPAIGYYDPEEYNWRKRIFLGRLLANSLSQIIPKNIINVIESATKNKFEKLNLILNTIILGIVLKPNNDAPVAKTKNNQNYKQYNLSYHMWIQSWEEYYDEKTRKAKDEFELNIKLGIFDPKGLIQLTKEGTGVTEDNYIIDFGKLAPAVNVHFHGSRFSPNNAFIGIQPDQAFSSFWALAISQDDKHVSLTYFLLANTEKAENLIIKIFSENKNSAEIVKNIEKYKKNLKQDDFNILKDYFINLNKIIPEEKEEKEKVSINQVKVDKLFDEINELATRIENSTNLQDANTLFDQIKSKQVEINAIAKLGNVTKPDFIKIIPKVFEKIEALKKGEDTGSNLNNLITLQNDLRLLETLKK